MAQVVAQGDDRPAFDVHCPLLSLPLAFATTLDTIPADVPYLSVPPDQTEGARKRLPAGRPLVGLAWSGNPDNKGDWKRSVPLADLVPLLSLPGTPIRQPTVRRARSGSGDFGELHRHRAPAG